MPRQTIAEKYRQHRREFVLAQELGCTPIEARAKIRWDKARERIERSGAGIAKRADAAYPSGRTDAWLKFKCEAGQELVGVLTGHGSGADDDRGVELFRKWDRNICIGSNL